MSKEKVMIFDTTLRDGEQAAGTRLGAREKLEIARQLVRLNVDIIEAGFPASSPEDFEAVRLISEQIEGPVICGLTRARGEDIEVCRKALAKAKRFRIHTGIGVSEIHIAGKFADDKYGKTMGRTRGEPTATTCTRFLRLSLKREPLLSTSPIPPVIPYPNSMVVLSGTYEPMCQTLPGRR